MSSDQTHWYTKTSDYRVACARMLEDMMLGPSFPEETHKDASPKTECSQYIAAERELQTLLEKINPGLVGSEYKVADCLQFANRELRRSDAGFPQYYTCEYKAGSGDLQRMQSLCHLQPKILDKSQDMLRLRDFYETLFEPIYKAHKQMEAAGDDAQEMLHILRSRDFEIGQLVFLVQQEVPVSVDALYRDVELCKQAAQKCMDPKAVHEAEIANSGKSR